MKYIFCLVICIVSLSIHCQIGVGQEIIAASQFTKDELNSKDFSLIINVRTTETVGETMDTETAVFLLVKNGLDYYSDNEDGYTVQSSDIICIVDTAEKVMYISKAPQTKKEFLYFDVEDLIIKSEGIKKKINSGSVLYDLQFDAESPYKQVQFEFSVDGYLIRETIISRSSNEVQSTYTVEILLEYNWNESDIPPRARLSEILEFGENSLKPMGLLSSYYIMDLRKLN